MAGIGCPLRVRLPRRRHFTVDAWAFALLLACGGRSGLVAPRRLSAGHNLCLRRRSRSSRSVCRVSSRMSRDWWRFSESPPDPSTSVGTSVDCWNSCIRYTIKTLIVELRILTQIMIPVSLEVYHGGSFSRGICLGLGRIPHAWNVHAIRVFKVSLLNHRRCWTSCITWRISSMSRTSRLDSPWWVSTSRHRRVRRCCPGSIFSTRWERVTSSPRRPQQG